MRNVKTALVCLAVASAAIAVTACGRRVTAAICLTGTEDAIAGIAAAKAPVRPDASDEVLTCKIGEYVVTVPRRKGKADIALVRDGHTSVVIDGSGTYVFGGADGRHLVYSATTGHPGGAVTTTYAGYSAAQHAWVENIDADSDGVVDVRRTETATEKRIEVWAGDRWTERKPGFAPSASRAPSR